jgi:hypothetical protein
MGVFSHLFGLDQKKDTPDLLPAIEQAVSLVEPLLKQAGRYPDAYRKPVKVALEYAHSLAFGLPGPVAVNPDSYAKDAYVRAIFPSMDFVSEAFQASRAIQDYLHGNPAADETYALMGMRRFEKTMMGMELSGQLIQRDVPQNVVYFTSHTIVDPAPSERQARERVALGFFKNLVGKVAKRVASRKQEMQSQLQELDLLKARLHAANGETRPALKKELSRMLTSLQNTTRSLDLHHYLDDFKAVLLNPEQHLHLNQAPMILDSMGIRRNGDGSEQGTQIIFNDLIGFDRRDWTVTMVYCSSTRNFKTDYLEKATRSLAKI